MSIKDIQITVIGLSNRSQNVLHRAGIFSVGEMMECTEESLKKLRNAGQKTIDEILGKIEEYKTLEASGVLELSEQEEINSEKVDFDAWLQCSAGRDYVSDWMQDRKIDELEFLPTKAYNLLRLNGYDNLGQIVFLEEEKLMEIPRMDGESASEIVKLSKRFLYDNRENILSTYAEEHGDDSDNVSITLLDMLHMEEYHDLILEYVQTNDRELSYLNLSNRPGNRLKASGYKLLSEILFMSKADFMLIPSMGSGSADEILEAIRNYLKEQEERLVAFCNGDDSVLLDDSAIRDLILKQYLEIGFDGLSLAEMKDRLQLPDAVSEERLKKNIGQLLADNELEYVDFRCYRVYGKFADCLEECDNIADRSREFIRKRLQGKTLEEIAQEYELTRERVRQVVKKDSQKVYNWYRLKTGNAWFDEDYYRYFYETYAFEKKDAIQWFGMTTEICNYLDMMDVKRGEMDLQSALEDTSCLDAGLRLKIKNYLNRNKIYVDGMWVNKTRADLENVVIQKLCTDIVSFEEFTQIYNRFLQDEDIPYDENLYITDEVYRTRESRISESGCLLWSMHKQFRYYDIEGRDFAELLDELNLEAYENIELSTLKLMENHPAILEKYDIRNHYELHNLLRRIVPEGSFHGFYCKKMPIIGFGSFDRDEAILDILLEHAPICADELCDLIHEEFGYDQDVVRANYLQPIFEYYHQGFYSIDQKPMSSENKTLLLQALSEDLYYIDEIRRIYQRILPGADPEEINPYNLKLMGFTVSARNAFRNYPTLDAYFENLLTQEDITDISSIRKRFAYSQSFSQKLTELKKRLTIIEFEPNQFIHFRKLEQAGINRGMIEDFCDAVFDFVENNSYFSAQTLKQDGFYTELYDLGFSDFFYGNLLLSDERFSSGRMFGNIILYKGQQRITVKSFETDLIERHGSIDVYDLASEMENYYGCSIPEPRDVVYKVSETKIYYDSYLDRLYSSKDAFDRELEEMEVI